MILRTVTLAAAAVAIGALTPAAYVVAQDQPAAHAPRTAKGTGVITEIDAKEASITLKHDPIPALGWPSMTMAFRVNPPSLIDGLKVGQKIGFDTHEGGVLPEITAIRKR